MYFFILKRKEKTVIKINSSAPTHVQSYYKLHKLLSSKSLVGSIQLVQRVHVSHDDAFNYRVIREIKISSEVRENNSHLAYELRYKPKVKNND